MYAGHRSPFEFVGRKRGIPSPTACLLGLTTLLFTACQPAPRPPIDAVAPTAAQHDTGAEAALDLNSVEALETFLRDEGIALTFNQEVALDYLPGTARIYEIGSGTDSLQLHAYSSVEETDEAAGLISPDAMFVDDLEDPGNPFKVEWMGSPHVYRSANLLATYIGDDERILAALTRAFGPQIAGF